MTPKNDNGDPGPEKPIGEMIREAEEGLRSLLEVPPEKMDHKAAAEWVVCHGAVALVGIGKLSEDDEDMDLLFG